MCHMSGTDIRPEVIVRKLIDHGPDSKPLTEGQRSSPLSPPWDGIYNAIRRAGGGANTRWAVFHRSIADHPDRIRIRLMVEDALKPPRPPAPSPDEKRFISAGAALHHRTRAWVLQIGRNISTPGSIQFGINLFPCPKELANRSPVVQACPGILQPAQKP